MGTDRPHPLTREELRHEVWEVVDRRLSTPDAVDAILDLVDAYREGLRRREEE